MNMFLTTLLISFGIQICFFAFAATLKTDKVTDFSYGLTFILIAVYLLFTQANPGQLQILAVTMVIIWGARLATYLFIRILKMKKDNRFDGIRENFIKFAKFWSFQAIAVWVIMLPTIYIFSLDKPIKLGIIGVIGIIIWSLGTIVESVADFQKFAFKNNPKNKDKFISSGMWRYSRHPNYFGEMFLWWGIFIMILPAVNGFAWLTITGPVFITFILLFVSGIPPLEKKYNERYKNNKKYQNYKKSTSLLIPLPPKQV